MAGEDSENQLTSGTNNQPEVPIEQPRADVDDTATQQAQNDAIVAQRQQEEARSRIKSISPEEKREMMQRTATPEWQQSRRDVSAASRSQLSDASLSREESRSILDFGGAREQWSPQISKSRARQNKRLSPASVPKFQKSRYELDEMVGSGEASYFRPSDQQQYMSRVKTRLASPSLSGKSREDVSEEYSRAEGTRDALGFFGGLTSRQRSSKYTQDKAFGMTMSAPSATKMYSTRNDSLKSNLEFTLREMGEEKERRTRYANTAPIGRLMMSQALGTRPWNQPKGIPGFFDGMFENARAQPRRRAPVRLSSSRSGPRRVQNPLSRSELMFFSPARPTTKKSRSRKSRRTKPNIRRFLW